MGPVIDQEKRRVSEFLAKDGLQRILERQPMFLPSAGIWEFQVIPSTLRLLGRV